MRSIALTTLSFLILCGATRPPADAGERRYWLDNMARHGFTVGEMSAATGIAEDELRETIRREKFDDQQRVQAALKVRKDKLLVLPYPGGRHPRIGFLEGAIDPQRDTKASIFAPWDPDSYLVVDVPEAIFTNLGLTYLAHTHVPTIWTEKKIRLEQVEWERRADGALRSRRRLPNGIEFETTVAPGKDEVRIEFALTNGSERPLTDVRVQVCNMLKGLKGFDHQRGGNVVFSGECAAARSADGRRWVIVRWSPLHRTWNNPPVPCIHADAKLPDVQPGTIRRAHGVVRFYEGEDVQGEIGRLSASEKADGG
jgi:hypothetical protein